MGYGYYPDGAENDPNAPYNQVDPEELEFEIECENTLSRTATIITDDYEGGYRDEEGYYEKASMNGNEEDKFNEDHYTVLELLSMYSALLDKEIDRLNDNKEYLESMFQSKEIRQSVIDIKREINRLEYIQNEVDSWDETDCDYHVV